MAMRPSARIALDRRLSANDPDLGAWTYSYDDAGRLTLQVDAKGQRTVLTYDALSRVKTKVTREGTAQAETTAYTYDEARAGYYNVGRLTTLANPAATIRYDHDQDGRLVRQQYVVDAVTHTLTNGYDISGRLLWRQFPDGDAIASAATPIAYDAAGRLKSVPGLVTDTVYDARGQATSVTRANTVNTTATYSPQRGWLTAMNTAKGATVIQDYGYTRDALGRITAVTSTQAGESWTYGYDDLDRLLSADNTTDNTLDQTWSYDSVDNMLSNSLVGSYSYPAPGSARPHAVSGVSGGPLGSQSFAYDANGSMTNQGGDIRAYDGENRLVSSTDGATTVQYVYGPDGARLKKIAGATTTLYLGADLEKTGTAWTKYLPGDAKRVGASSGPLYWMHRDHLQSVRAETDSTGAIVNSAKYRPYGERLTTIATIPEAKGFIGERHDPETGLMYLNARYYDPVLGRFMSADPMSPILPGVGVNRYAYAGNNPILYSDPSGLIFPVFAAAVVLGIEYTAAMFAADVAITGAVVTTAAIVTSEEYQEQVVKPLSEEITEAIAKIEEATEEEKPQETPPAPEKAAAGAPVAGTDPQPDAAPASGQQGQPGVTSLPAAQQPANPTTHAPAQTTDTSSGAPNPNGDNDEEKRATTLQSGGNTISNRTAKGLNEHFGTEKHSREWGRALEDMKKDNGLPNNHQGKIMSNGDYVDPKTGDVLGNIGDYAP